MQMQLQDGQREVQMLRSRSQYNGDHGQPRGGYEHGPYDAARGGYDGRGYDVGRGYDGGRGGYGRGGPDYGRGGYDVERMRYNGRGRGNRGGYNGYQDYRVHGGAWDDPAMAQGNYHQSQAPLSSPFGKGENDRQQPPTQQQHQEAPPQRPHQQQGQPAQGPTAPDSLDKK